MKRAMSPRNKNRLHAKQRALERYAFTLGNTGIGEIVSIIKRKDANSVLLSKQFPGRYVYKVYYRKQWVNVVYSVDTDTLVTFLPKKWDKKSKMLED